MKVAFLGTGLMGLPMATRLLENNIDLIAYNRTPEKLKPLKFAGAQVTTEPREAILAADCIILMLTNAAAIYSVLLSDMCWRTLSERTVIQMGTITPTESKQIRDTVISAGGEYLEAPVLGSVREAETGELIAMVGSQRQEFQRHLKLLKNFSPEPVHIGPVGTAAALKLALNQLTASLTSAFALSLSFVKSYDVDVEVLMQILRESPLYAPIFDRKLSRMENQNFGNPNFRTKHLLKDTDLFIDEAKNIGLNVSSVEGVRKILEKAIKISFANADYSSLFAAINSISEVQ